MRHPIWELPILAGKSALILTPCPGTKEVDLITSLKQLKTQGVQAIVTALDCDEMVKAGVADLPVQSKALGMEWFNLPIEDDCAPDDLFAMQWQKVSPELHHIANQGGKLAMHCMGGSGRTGLLAANFLLEQGWDLETIKSEIQTLRPGAFRKPVQIEYVDKLAAK